jgi:hypothetical protein
VKGYGTLTLHFGEARTIRKVKLYLPNAIDEELPKGYITIPGQPKGLELNKIILNRSEYAPNGDWYVYDLGRLYVTDRIQISIKGGYDSVKKVANEIRVYEIIVTGFSN